MEIIQTHKGIPLEKKEDGNIRGMVPSFTQEVDKPVVVWHGAQFPRKLYLQTVAFAKYCADEYGGEVQGRLYYSNEKKQWKVCVLPQYVSRDLASLEIEGHKDRNEAMKSVSGKGDWKQNGTWHSHAFAGAGVSHTDEIDEVRAAGFHYTVGSLRMQESSFHGRFVFNKMMYDISSVLRKTTASPYRCTAFPPQWKDAIIMAVRPKDVIQRYISDGDGKQPFPTYGQIKSANEIQDGLVRRAIGFQPNRAVTPTDDIIPDQELIGALSAAFREPEAITEAFCTLALFLTGASDIAEAFSVINQEVEDISADAYTAMTKEEEMLEFFGYDDGYGNMR